MVPRQHVFRDVGTDIYVPRKKARLVYRSTAASGAVLKSKRSDHTTLPSADRMPLA